mmetsp:Transcript_75896/g.219178  ORF Transcript_75896/g.219178 Transcript_75896/m.219178 type:complete len:206 (+) Transcript_75896:611-1228(+)
MGEDELGDVEKGAPSLGGLLGQRQGLDGCCLRWRHPGSVSGARCRRREGVALASWSFALGACRCVPGADLRDLASHRQHRDPLRLPLHRLREACAQGRAHLATDPGQRLGLVGRESVVPSGHRKATGHHAQSGPRAHRDHDRLAPLDLHRAHIALRRRLAPALWPAGNLSTTLRVHQRRRLCIRLAGRGFAPGQEGRMILAQRWP